MLINQIDLLDVKVEYRLKERDLQTVCGGLYWSRSSHLAEAVWQTRVFHFHSETVRT